MISKPLVERGRDPRGIRARERRRRRSGRGAPGRPVRGPCSPGSRAEPSRNRREISRLRAAIASMPVVLEEPHRGEQAREPGTVVRAGLEAVRKEVRLDREVRAAAGSAFAERPRARRPRGSRARPVPCGPITALCPGNASRSTPRASTSTGMRSHRLGRVEQEERPALAREAADLGRGLDAAADVGRVRHRRRAACSSGAPRGRRRDRRCRPRPRGRGSPRRSPSSSSRASGRSTELWSIQVVTTWSPGLTTPLIARLSASVPLRPKITRSGCVPLNSRQRRARSSEQHLPRDHRLAVRAAPRARRDLGRVVDDRLEHRIRLRERRRRVVEVDARGHREPRTLAARAGVRCARHAHQPRVRRAPRVDSFPPRTRDRRPTDAEVRAAIAEATQLLVRPAGELRRDEAPADPVQERRGEEGARREAEGRAKRKSRRKSDRRGSGRTKASTASSGLIPPGYRVGGTAIVLLGAARIPGLRERRAAPRDVPARHRLHPRGAREGPAAAERVPRDLRRPRLGPHLRAPIVLLRAHERGALAADVAKRAARDDPRS